MKIKKGRRRWVKRALWSLLLIVLYMVVGMMAPFIKRKPVSAEYKKNFNIQKFYGSKTSVDRAAIVETGTDALDERIRMLNQAEERIILSTFDMREGESTKDVLSVILNAAQRGVKVQIMVDGISGLIRMEGEPVFYAVSSHPNIEIRLYNKPNPLMPWTIHGRMHDKYIIVDDKFYIMGGRNSFDYFLGDYIEDNKSLDREVLIYNTAHGQEASKESSLGELEAYFYSVWNLKYCKPFHNDERLMERKSVQAEIHALQERYELLQSERPELFAVDDHYEETTVPIKKATLISNPTDIYGKEPTAWYQIQQLMENAKERVVLHTPYAVMDTPMYEGFKTLSGKGIDFKMVINSVENGDNIVASSDYLKYKSKIIQTGVELYEYDGGISSHGKSLLIDDNISIVGSFNFDLRSTYVDTELMLAIDSEALNKDLEAKMDVFQKDCRKVIDEKNYEVPEHVTVAEVPTWKRIIWAVLGVVLQPFRVLV